MSIDLNYCFLFAFGVFLFFLFTIFVIWRGPLSFAFLKIPQGCYLFFAIGAGG